VKPPEPPPAPVSTPGSISRYALSLSAGRVSSRPSTVIVSGTHRMPVITSASAGLASPAPVPVPVPVSVPQAASAAVAPRAVVASITGMRLFMPL
jgi:hypothetical protein